MVTTDRALSLNDVIRHEVPLLPSCFRHMHLKRKPKIGIIGEPGSGKSVTMGYLMFKLYAIFGEPMWANLPIKYTYNVPQEIAAKYGLQEGKAVFESGMIDYRKLIKMDRSYAGGCLGFDEINIKLADALRSTSNVNFYFDQVDQQLRKDESGLIYTCIDEMWVDYRIRDLTDIFILCQDMALTEEGLAAKKTEGVDIKWTVYPMTSMYNGRPFNKYHETDILYFKARPYWGIIDTTYKQATGEKYARDVFAEDEAETNKQTAMDKIKTLKENGVKSMPVQDLMDYMKEDLDLNNQKLHNLFREIGLRREGTREHPGDYIIPAFTLDRKTTVRDTGVVQ